MESLGAGRTLLRKNVWVGGGGMESYQWFLLGIMVAFTPSLLVLGVLLARSMDQPADTKQSGE